MAQSQIPLPHKLILEERKKLNLTGVTEVIHFDEEVVELNTALGVLCVTGTGLRLKCLSLEDGAVVIQGDLSSLSYEEGKPRRRLFR